MLVSPVASAGGVSFFEATRVCECGVVDLLKVAVASAPPALELFVLEDGAGLAFRRPAQGTLLAVTKHVHGWLTRGTRFDDWPEEDEGPRECEACGGSGLVWWDE